MKISRKRAAGEILGRAGISAEIIKICIEVANEQSYKKAMIAAGRIKALCDAATYDGYWAGKAAQGASNQEGTFEYMLQTIKAGGSKSVCY
jgi:hypothetical protein